jgi:light-regulated signal transduction histidine kinase (bacteriophytochrome)
LPDLLLLDVLMPDMDGFQVLAALRANPRTHDIPVIFITGLDTPTDEFAGLQVGAADYIVKPLAAPVVLARVQTQIALKRARDTLRQKNEELQAEIARRGRLELETRHLNSVLQARTQALERTVADLETFSYSLSHDLRSPLSTISGFADLLQRLEATRLTEEGKRRLARIMESARRMDLTIRDILACMQAQRADLHVQAVDLSALVQDVMQDVAPAYPGTQFVRARLPLVQADPVMARQVLANLIGNAFKFSAKASLPRVEIGLQPAPRDDTAPDQGVEIFVRDNGAGFDPQYADRLFQLFQRMHTQEDFAGTGVGLTIVKRLVERHGGYIRAEAALGSGATFSFTLWPASAAPSISEP